MFSDIIKISYQRRLQLWLLANRVDYSHYDVNTSQPGKLQSDLQIQFWERQQRRVKNFVNKKMQEYVKYIFIIPRF